MNLMHVLNFRPFLSPTPSFALVTLLAAASARGDMLKPAPTPGGIDPRPSITSLTPAGTNLTVSFHGLQASYVLQRTGTLGPATWSNVAAVNLLYPAYDIAIALTDTSGMSLFRVAMTNNSYRGAGDCYNCHSDIYNSWSGTAHASALNQVIGLPPSVQKNCLVCHTVGYGQAGGFVDTNTTPLLANVQCENCHGPAGAHKLVSNRKFHPVKTAAAEVCGGCHTDSHHPTYEEWTQSAHSAVTPDLAGAGGFLSPTGGASREMSCGPCHSTAVRLAMLQDYDYRLTGYTNNLTLPSGADAAAFGQTCVACHDPHSTNSNPAQLRSPISSTNFYSFTPGSVSATYYFTNLSGAVTSTTYYSNDVFATQYVASVQICAQCHNARGAKWTDTSRPPHHSGQYNFLLGSVGELATGSATYQPSTHAGFFTNQCVDCHMQSRAYQSETNPAVTGHKFSVGSYDVCVQCHGSTASNLAYTVVNVLVPLQAQRVKAALDAWAATKAPSALYTKYGSRAWEYTNPGSLSTGGSGPSTSEQALIPDNIKKARFDLYLVVDEPGAGVHNPFFVTDLLDAALGFVQIELNK